MEAKKSNKKKGGRKKINMCAAFDTSTHMWTERAQVEVLMITIWNEFRATHLEKLLYQLNKEEIRV